MDAKALIEAIREEKNKAIASGILRKEKPFATITDRDIPRKLPEGWQWCRLGDYAMKVTDYVASGSFASLKENVLITNEENYAVMVKTADFANGFSKNLTYTDERGYRFLENSNLYGGELILSNIGSIGKVFIVPNLNRPMTLASNTIMIRMTHDEYNKYMYYMFTSSFGQKLLMSIASGTSMLKFNKTQLKSTIIPVAPLEKQYKICDILDKVQSIVIERKTELEKFDELIKARFVELFDNGNYPKIKLGNACKKITDGTHKTPNYLDEGITFISAKNIVAGELDFSDVKHISEEEYQEIQKRCQTEKNDILLSKSGSLGAPVIVRTEEKLGLFESLAVLKYDRDRFLPEFLCEQLKSDTVQRQFTIGTKGVAIKHLHLGVIADTEVIEPPMEEQKAFADFVKHVDKSKLLISVIIAFIQSRNLQHRFYLRLL